jgi:hypothetical protein
VSLLRAWLARWLLRAGLYGAAALLLLHLALNRVVVPLINRRVLPGLCADASRLSMRRVRRTWWLW